MFSSIMSSSIFKKIINKKTLIQVKANSKIYLKIVPQAETSKNL